jgi:hypothetical protein
MGGTNNIRDTMPHGYGINHNHRFNRVINMHTFTDIEAGTEVYIKEIITGDPQQQGGTLYGVRMVDLDANEPVGGMHFFRYEQDAIHYAKQLAGIEPVSGTLSIAV